MGSHPASPPTFVQTETLGLVARRSQLGLPELLRDHRLRRVEHGKLALENEHAVPFHPR